MTETTATAPTVPFVRPRDNRMIAGVCAGIAERWHLDLTLVRIVTVVATLVSGVGLAAYLAVWLLTPSVDGPAPIRPDGRPARLARRLPAVALIVLAVILFGGLAHTLWWGAPIGLIIAALVVALVVGTRRGRWALVTFAALIAVALGTVGVFGTHFGTRNYTVTSVDELQSSYDYGVGRVNLDLSSLTVTGRQRTDVHLGRGDVNITVPSSTAVVVHARSGVGSVTVNGRKVSGIDAEQTQSLGDATGTAEDRLVIDVVVGVGAVHVHT